MSSEILASPRAPTKPLLGTLFLVNRDPTKAGIAPKPSPRKLGGLLEELVLAHAKRACLVGDLGRLCCFRLWRALEGFGGRRGWGGCDSPKAHLHRYIASVNPTDPLEMPPSYVVGDEDDNAALGVLRCLPFWMRELAAVTKQRRDLKGLKGELPPSPKP